MIYRFIRSGASQYATSLASDLSARKAAEATTDIDRVETVDGRVVWRRVEPIIGLHGDLSNWLDRKK